MLLATLFLAFNQKVKKQMYEQSPGRKLARVCTVVEVSFKVCLQRDAMCKRSPCCCPISVSPSDLFMHCIQTVEDTVSVKLLSWPSSHIILFFDPKCRYPIPRGTSSVVVQNIQGGKNLRFLTEIAIYLRNGMR